MQKKSGNKYVIKVHSTPFSKLNILTLISKNPLMFFVLLLVLSCLYLNVVFDKWVLQKEWEVLLQERTADLIQLQNYKLENKYHKKLILGDNFKKGNKYDISFRDCIND